MDRWRKAAVQRSRRCIHCRQLHRTLQHLQQDACHDVHIWTRIQVQSCCPGRCFWHMHVRHDFGNYLFHEQRAMLLYVNIYGHDDSCCLHMQHVQASHSEALGQCLQQRNERARRHATSHCEQARKQCQDCLQSPQHTLDCTWRPDRRQGCLAGFCTLVRDAFSLCACCREAGPQQPLQAGVVERVHVLHQLHPHQRSHTLQSLLRHQLARQFRGNCDLQHCRSCIQPSFSNGPSVFGLNGVCIRRREQLPLRPPHHRIQGLQQLPQEGYLHSLQGASGPCSPNCVKNAANQARNGLGSDTPVRILVH
mmetsp:Transcript_12855/g.38812  ORF Transcript_12855/g.38812 Transcript_12855/m.38812 type:complete len:308 (-) Transcript_12855:879-1802(-)